MDRKLRAHARTKDYQERLVGWNSRSFGTLLRNQYLVRPIKISESFQVSGCHAPQQDISLMQNSLPAHESTSFSKRQRESKDWSFST